MTTTPYPVRIVRTPGLTIVVYEGGAQVRRQIFTDGPIPSIRIAPGPVNPSATGKALLS
jgi:hypothetical protein